MTLRSLASRMAALAALGAAVGCQDHPAPASIPTTGDAAATTPAPVASSIGRPVRVPAALTGVGTPVSAFPPAPPGSPEALSAALDAIFLPAPTYRARFTQTVQAKGGKALATGGQLVVVKPDRFSFRYDAPNSGRLVCDGASITLYQPVDGKAFIQPASRSLYPDALLFLTALPLRASLVLSFPERDAGAGGPFLLARPLQRTPSFEVVTFKLDQAELDRQDPAALHVLLFKDADGNTNRYDFTDVSQPSRVDPAEFAFDVPAGTKVFRPAPGASPNDVGAP